MKQSLEWIGNQQNGKKFLQFTHLTKGWYPAVTKNSNRFTGKNQTSPFKNGQRIWTDTLLKKTYMRPTNIWKNTHNHWSLERCKSKPHWDTISRFLKTLDIGISFDPAIPLLDIYPKDYKSLYYKDTCTHMFIMALLIIEKSWNQPKCPSMID